MSVSVHIAKDRDTDTPRGFAFVTFTSSTDCNKACSAMDGKVCHVATQCPKKHPQHFWF